jgi:hypothetical protein
MSYSAIGQTGAITPSVLVIAGVGLVGGGLNDRKSERVTPKKVP